MQIIRISSDYNQQSKNGQTITKNANFKNSQPSFGILDLSKFPKLEDNLGIFYTKKIKQALKAVQENVKNDGLPKFSFKSVGLDLRNGEINPILKASIESKGKSCVGYDNKIYCMNSTVFYSSNPYSTSNGIDITLHKNRLYNWLHGSLKEIATDNFKDFFSKIYNEATKEL